MPLEEKPFQSENEAKVAATEIHVRMGRAAGDVRTWSRSTESPAD